MDALPIARGLLVSALLFVPARVTLGTEAATTAQLILAESGVRGGIVVHLGCQSGDLTVALRADERFLVQALTTDPERVAVVRGRIDAAQLSGPISVEFSQAATLPYVDNLVNLVVAEQTGLVPIEEIMRVLVPNGVACLREDDQWVYKIKPRPESIDQWTHYLHDASNNAVAKDAVVGPPRSLQWGASPLWLRSHETPSGIQSPVSAGGRLFFFLDEGPIGITDERLPDRWSLVCRDAFNGKLLWKRSLGTWGWREWSRARYEGKDWLQLRGRRTDVPAENQRRIVAQGDRLYATLSYRAPMSILDASSGKVIVTVAETAPAREVLVSQGVALAYSQERSPGAARRRGQEKRLTAKLVAVHADSGCVLWQKPCSTIRPGLLTINGGRIIYCTGRELVAVELRSGKQLWRVAMQRANLRTPVMAQGRLFVAQKDTHRVHALDATTGKRLWQFTAGGRIDSPPTIDNGLVLFGSCDGHVYCLRADNGALVWRFLAAPHDQRIAYFERIESSWPVHGSVLIDQGVAYFTAGRSTYLDGGIRVYGLDPQSGALRYMTVLQGPFPNGEDDRDVSFYVLGANSDILVSEGGSLYMRQKKLTHELAEVPVEVLSSKGAQDVGLHVFSTSGLLDGSWYNRTFWMYSRRWPGFQLANQASKTGQLLVVGDQNTYALRVFYHRNVHSPMFFPDREGYLLFADANTNEPQIVGESGSREPVRWLPQSDFSRARGDEVRKLGSESFGLDKMIGYTRAEPPLWTCWLPVRVRGMVKAGPNLFVAGAPDVLDQEKPLTSLLGRRGARLVTVSAANGKVLHATSLAAPPVFDGMIAAGDCLYASLTDGSVVCLGKR